MNDLNITAGSSAKKEHWSRGSRTACNRKMSVGKMETADFSYFAEKYPEMCCAKCLRAIQSTHKK